MLNLVILQEKEIRMTYTVNVIYAKDEHGYYVFCLQLAGCQSQGGTVEEARTTIQEAIELYLETLSKDEISKHLSHEVITSSLEIAIA